MKQAELPEYIVAERTFFDQHYQIGKAETKPQLARTVQRGSQREFHHLISNIQATSKVLEIGCGQGELAVEIARKAAFVTGIDISNVGLESARSLAARSSLESKTEFICSPVELHPFKERSFDFIVDNEVFSSIDIETALPQLKRVLKDTGKLIGIETFGENPIFNLKRRYNLCRGTRTRWMVDHIFNFKRLNIMERYFRIEKIYFFHFSALGLTPMAKLLPHNTAESLLQLLERFDQWLLSKRSLRGLAFKIVFEATPLK